MDTLYIYHSLSLSFYAAAGFIFYIQFINRILFNLPDSKMKDFSFIFSFFLFVPGAVAIGYLAALSLWLFIPLSVIVLFLISEIWLLSKKAHQKIHPVSQKNIRCSIKQPLTTMDLSIYRYRIRSPFVRDDKIRIAHLSDIHFSDKIPRDFYITSFEQVLEANPDLVVLTGDFISEKRFLKDLPGLLKIIRAKLGVYAVLGNHDYWESAQAVRDTLRSAGITLLENNCQRITTENRTNILICGCDYPWRKRQLRIADRREDELFFVLTHTPDNIHRLSKLKPIAVFSGHYHGGQIKLPILRPFILPSKFGNRFDRGYFVLKSTNLFVSAGVGAGFPYFRMFCKPDIIFVDFVPESEKTAGD